MSASSAATTAASAAIARVAGKDALAQVLRDGTVRGVPRGRERFTDPPVQMGSARAADLLEKGLAHQRVRERERAGSVGHLP